MRILVVLLTSLITSASALPLQDCEKFAPFGFPTSPKQNTTMICRSGYVLEHDNKAKIPAWVSYTLSAEGAVGCADRAESFKPDPDLQVGARAELKDYAKSGYDIGHMANSADMRGSKDLSSESNILSNAAPQLPGLNRLSWKILEMRTRSWALSRGNLLIYVGPVYSYKDDKRIGKNEVLVPSAFFKVIIDMNTGETLSFLYPHVESKARPEQFLTSIQEVQRAIGFSLPLPKNFVRSEQLWSSAESVTKSKVCTIR